MFPSIILFEWTVTYYQIAQCNNTISVINVGILAIDWINSLLHQIHSTVFSLHRICRGNKVLKTHVFQGRRSLFSQRMWTEVVMSRFNFLSVKNRCHILAINLPYLIIGRINFSYLLHKLNLHVHSLHSRFYPELYFLYLLLKSIPTNCEMFC